MALRQSPLCHLKLEPMLELDQAPECRQQPAFRCACADDHSGGDAAVQVHTAAGQIQKLSPPAEVAAPARPLQGMKYGIVGYPKDKVAQVHKVDLIALAGFALQVPGQMRDQKLKHL